MIETIKVVSGSDPLFERVWQVYEYSFPQHEKRSRSNQIESLTLGAEISAFCEGDRFLGFMIFWRFETFIYIEHLALNKEVRSLGYGSKLLSTFIAQNSDKCVVLDIDPPIDDISIRRERFYERLGFVKNRYKHIHPPYNSENGESFELQLLSHGRALLEDEFLSFKKRLYNTIVTY